MQAGAQWWKSFPSTDMRGHAKPALSEVQFRKAGGANQAVPGSGTTAWPEDKGVPVHWSCSAAESAVLILSWLIGTATALTKPTAWGLRCWGSVQHSATQPPPGNSSTTARSPWAQAEPQTPGRHHWHRTNPSWSSSCNFLFCCLSFGISQRMLWQPGRCCSAAAFVQGNCSHSESCVSREGESSQ